jgi:tetratricopeptide (TPR) repeat protein
LVAAKPPQVVDTVLQALSTERDNKLLPSYVEYLAAAVAGHDGAARALLPLLDRERLEWQDTKRLVQALASVAPANHEPTCQRLHVMIDAGETNSIGVQAALTLRALGDGKGVDKLRRTLNEQLRKPQRKKEPGLYEQRGNLLLAIEDYADAYADFEKMLEYANDESAMGRRAHGGMMRVEARRKKVAALLKLIKASNMTAEEIEAIGNDDPVFAETLQQDKVRAALQALGKDGPGK